MFWQFCEPRRRSKRPPERRCSFAATPPLEPSGCQQGVAGQRHTVVPRTGPAGAIRNSPRLLQVCGAGGLRAPDKFIVARLRRGRQLFDDRVGVGVKPGGQVVHCRLPVVIDSLRASVRPLVSLVSPYMVRPTSDFYLRRSGRCAGAQPRPSACFIDRSDGCFPPALSARSGRSGRALLYRRGHRRWSSAPAVCSPPWAIG